MNFKLGEVGGRIILLGVRMRHLCVWTVAGLFVTRAISMVTGQHGVSDSSTLRA